MSGNNVPQSFEGNLAEIDTDAKFIRLQLRDGSSVKIFYKPAHEQTIARQKVGYYEKPTVEPTSDPKEFVLVDLPYTARPEGFPKLQGASKGQYGGGRPYQQPRNEKAIMFECALKAMVDLYVGGLGGTVNGKGFDAVADSIIEKAVKATEEGVKVAGVQ